MSDLDDLFDDFAERVRSGRTFPIVQKAFGATPIGQSTRAPFSLPPKPAHPVTQKVSQARVPQAAEFLFEVARAALKQVSGIRRRVSQQDVEEAFDAAIERQHKTVMGALGARRKETKRLKDERAALGQERAAMRKALGVELKSARADLRRLRAQVKDAEASVARAHAAAAAIAGEQYPTVPPAALEPHKEGEGLPAESGIYFLWRGGIVDYVGQSIRLSSRVKLGSHGILTAQHRISYVLVKPRELDWAECHYIGMLCPSENFGRSASHRKYD